MTICQLQDRLIVEFVVLNEGVTNFEEFVIKILQIYAKPTCLKCAPI